MLMQGIISLQVQVFALPFVKLHEIPVSRFLQSVMVPLMSHDLRLYKSLTPLTLQYIAIHVLLAIKLALPQELPNCYSINEPYLNIGCVFTNC